MADITSKTTEQFHTLPVTGLTKEVKPKLSVVALPVRYINCDLFLDRFFS